VCERPLSRVRTASILFLLPFFPPFWPAFPSFRLAIILTAEETSLLMRGERYLRQSATTTGYHSSYSSSQARKVAIQLAAPAAQPARGQEIGVALLGNPIIGLMIALAEGDARGARLQLPSRAPDSPPFWLPTSLSKALGTMADLKVHTTRNPSWPRATETGGRGRQARPRPQPHNPIGAFLPRPEKGFARFHSLSSFSPKNARASERRRRRHLRGGVLRGQDMEVGKHSQWSLAVFMHQVCARSCEVRNKGEKRGRLYYGGSEREGRAGK